MIVRSRFLIAISVLGIVLPALNRWGFADEQAESQPAPQLEPVDFIDNARPAQTDGMNRRPAQPAVTNTGWGSAVFSPDGKILVTVSNSEAKDLPGEVVLWDIAESKILHKYEQSTRIVTVSFSPDGNWLAIGPQSPQAGVKLLDVKTGEVAMTLPGPVARTNAMAWSQDGTRLALASTLDKSVRVWNVTERKFEKAFEPEAATLFSIVFTTSGELLAAGSPVRDREGLAIFDITAGTLEKTLKGHKELIEMATFSPDGTKLTSVGWDATVRTWDVESGEETAALKGHKKGINAVAMTPDAKRLASATPREFKLWDGEKKESLGDLGDDNTGAKYLAFSSDGVWLASISRDGIARLWDVEKKTEKSKFDRESGTATTMGDGDDGVGNANRTQSASTSDSPEPEAIQAMAYSRDGKWIALAREDGRISIRHAEDGRVAREIEAFADVAACVAFSRDSSRLAAGSFDRSIKIWDVTTGDQLADLTGHSNWVFSVAFSNDGSILASGSYDKTIKLWNVAEAKEIATINGHTAGVRSVCFSNNDQQLISGAADRTTIVWNLADQTQVVVLKGHAAAVRAVVWSPDGTTVATASEDATVKLWKTSDWTERASLPGADGVMFWCLAFSPAGRTLAAGAFNGTVKLFDPVEGKERKTLQGPNEPITAVAFAPGALEIIASSIDKSLRRWKAETGTAAVAAAKSGTNEKTPELKPTAATTGLNAVLLNIQQPVQSLGISRDGKRIAVGTGLYRAAGSLQLWDVAKREKIWQSDPFRYGVSAVAFSHDEKRIAAGNFADNFLRLYDIENGKQIKEIRGCRRNITGLAYSPNGKLIAAGSDKDIKLWDVSTNKEAKTISGHADFIYSIAFSPDSKHLLSGSYDRTAKLWNVETGTEVAHLKGHIAPIQQAVFSPDGSMIATASHDKTVRIYTATGDYLLTLRGHTSKVETVAFSKNGKLVATGAFDKTVRLWDSESGVEILTMTQEGIVRAVTFSHDGKYLVSGCDDKSVKLWDVSGFKSNDSSLTDVKSR